MKLLVEFILQGQRQAMAVAAIATLSLFLAWVGAAVVALVVLRFGLVQAMSVIVAALIPATFWVYFLHDIGPLTTIVCAATLAAVLRTSRSWSTMLVCMPLVLGVFTQILMAAAPDVIAYMHALVVEFINTMQTQTAGLEQASADAEAVQRVMDRLQPPTELQLMGLYAVSQSLTVLLSLCLARWWQALAFNPGGFQQEFHQLRLSKLSALFSVLGLALLANSANYAVWAWLFVVPIVVAGFALIHGLIAQKTKGGHWIILFYLAVAIAPDKMIVLLMLLALVDSALGFRGKAAAS